MVMAASGRYRGMVEMRYQPAVRIHGEWLARGAARIRSEAEKIWGCT